MTTPSTTAPQALETYYFVGSSASISGPGYHYALTRFGQAVELTEPQAELHAAAGARLVPAAAFQAVPFTPEELEQNSDLLAHDVTAEEDFMFKRPAAFEAADAFRTKALNATVTSTTKD